MTWFDKGFLAFYFFAIILIQCLYQARRFKANKPISHAWHVAYYFAAVAPMVLLYPWWKVLVVAVIERLALFDFTLNLCRRKNLFYNSGKSAANVLDRLENRLSTTWVRVLKVMYVVVFIIVLIKLK